MEIQSSSNLMQMLGTTEPKEPGNSVNGEFSSIFNAKIEKLPGIKAGAHVTATTIVAVKLDENLSDCLHFDNNKLKELLPNMPVSAETAQKMVDIIASIRLLEQVVLLESGTNFEKNLEEDAPLQNEPQLAEGVLSDPEWVEFNESEGNGLQSEGEKLSSPSINELPEDVIADTRSDVIALFDSEVMLPKSESNKIPKDVEADKNKDAIGFIKSDQKEISPEEKEEIVSQAAIEIQFLRQALIDLIRRALQQKSENQKADTSDLEVQKKPISSLALKITFNDAVIEVQELSTKFVSNQKKSFQLDIFSPQTIESKILTDKDVLENSLSHLVGVLQESNEGENSLTEMPKLDKFASMNDVAPNLKDIVKNELMQTMEKPQSSQKDLIEETHPLDRNGLRKLPEAPISNNSIVTNKKSLTPESREFEPSVVSKVNTNPVEKNPHVLQLNGLMKELHAKAVFSGLQNKVATVENPVAIDSVKPVNIVPVISELEVPIEELVSSSAKKLMPIETDNKAFEKNLSVDDFALGHENSKQQKSVKATYPESKILIESKPIIIASSSTAFDETIDSRLNDSVKSKAIPQREIVDFSKIQQDKLAVADGSVSQNVLRNSGSEKELSHQRKAFKEMITNANKDSVVEVKPTNLHSRNLQIVPAGRLLEHLPQDVIGIENDIEGDSVALDLQALENATIDQSLNVSESLLEEMASDTDSAEIHLVENEKNVLDNSSLDKRNVLVSETNRQDILERINQVAVVQKMMKKVQVQKLLSEGVVQLRIDPPELGQLLLKMTVKNHEVTLHVTSENQQAKELIMNQKHLFIQNMKDIGLDVKSIEVHVTKDGAHDFSRESGQQAQQQRNRQSHQAPKFFSKEVQTEPSLIENIHVNGNKSHLNMIA